jgi:hypothetical protein
MITRNTDNIPMIDTVTSSSVEALIEVYLSTNESERLRDK